MRRIAMAAVIAAFTLPLLASQGAVHGANNLSAPQGDEFNNTSFVAPFTVECGEVAVLPCPDAQGPKTWSLNGQAPGYLRIMTQLGSLVGPPTSSNNARNFVVQ